MAGKVTGMETQACEYVPLSEVPGMKALNYEAIVPFEVSIGDKTLTYHVQRVTEDSLPKNLQTKHINFVKFSVIDGQKDDQGVNVKIALEQFNLQIDDRDYHLKETFDEVKINNPACDTLEPEPKKLDKVSQLTRDTFEPESQKLDKISQLTRDKFAVIGESSVVIVFEKGALTQNSKGAVTLRGKRHTIPEMKKWKDKGADVVIRSKEMNWDNPSEDLMKCTGKQDYYTKIIPAVLDEYPHELDNVIKAKLKKSPKIDVYVLAIDERSNDINIKNTPDKLAAAIARQKYGDKQEVSVKFFAMTDL